MFRYKLRTLMIVLALSGVVFALWRVAAEGIKPSAIYEVRAEFRAMPTDDEPFRLWVVDQPGVWAADVHRDAKGINVVFGMSRNLRDQPPPPDFHGNFERFGYHGLTRLTPVHSTTP
jgi:hypothetical protein